MIGGLSPLVRLRDFSFGRMRVLLAGGAFLRSPGGTYRLETQDYLTYQMVHSVSSYSLKNHGGSYGAPFDFGIGARPDAPVIPLAGPGQEFFIEPRFWEGSWEPLSTPASAFIEGDYYAWPFETVSFVSNITVYKLHDVFEPFTSDWIVQSTGAVVVVSRVVDGAWQEIWRSASGVNLSTRRQGSQLLVVEAKKLRLTYDPLPDVLANLDHFGDRLEVWMETEMSGGSREWRRLFRSAPAAQISIAALQSAGLVDGDGYVTQLDSAGQLPVYGRNALGPFSVVDTFRPAT